MTQDKNPSPPQSWWFRGAVLGVLAVSCLVGGLIYRSARSAARARNLLDQPLGCAGVAGVEESGFYSTEGSRRRYRWTNGAAKLVVPIGRVSPQALTTILGVDTAKPFRVAIRVNGYTLFDEKISHRGLWTRTFDLAAAPVQSDMVIEILSDVFIPAQLNQKNKDTRQLGVRIYNLTLLSGIQEYVNVPLGGDFVPGVEEAGFFKADQEGDTSLRWTTGAAMLKVPVRRKRPKALVVTMDVPAHLKDRLGIVVNGRKLVDEPAQKKNNWTRKLSLDGVDFQEQLLIEVQSSTWIPARTVAGSADQRALGVRLKKVLLLEE